MKKKHGNLVKKLVLRDGPQGLYPNLLLMEGKDMEDSMPTFPSSM